MQSHRPVKICQSDRYSHIDAGSAVDSLFSYCAQIKMPCITLSVKYANYESILFQSQKKMASETPPTISMALNPQMPSASADSKNSSTQQLSISV